MARGLIGRVLRILLLVLVSANTARLMWQTWGKPEFWPLVIASLIFTVIIYYASKNRHEDLQARLPGARTFGQ